MGQAIDAHRTASRTAEALTELRREIARDDAALAAAHPLHVRVHAAFASTVAGARDETLSYDAFAGAFARTAPKGFHPFAGTTTANVPYALRATLQRRYDELTVLQGENASLLARLYASPTEPKPNLFFTAIAATLVTSDITASETRVAAADTDALRALAAGGAS